MSPLLHLGLANAQVSAPAPIARARDATWAVALLALVLIFAIPSVLGPFLDDGRSLGMGAEELKAATALLVSAGVFFVGFVTRKSAAKGPSEESIDFDEIVESLLAFEEAEDRRRAERKTLHYNEFKFPE